MKRLSFVCLLLSSALLLARAADPTEADQAEVLRRSGLFDTAVRDRTDLRAFVHSDYTYVEPLKDALTPPPKLADRTARLADRLNRDACFSLEPLTVTIVGPTAIVTGSYEVVERGSGARQFQPRLVLRGQFTETWIKLAPTSDWLLLAEHRSLHDMMTWASVLAAADVARKTSTAPPPAEPEPPTRNEQRRIQLKEAAAHRGLLPPTVRDLFRSYESTAIGYTSDQDDDSFMDFSFSAMFPLWAPDNYPAHVRRHASPGFFPHPAYSRFNIYGAATIRAGQYIGTRPSSPVVGKRFNPLLAARLWALDGKELASEDNFLEFVYAHESNGQFIANKARLDEQTAIYRKQVLESRDNSGAAFPVDVAGRSARDNISRGWDYVGVNFSRDWDTPPPPFLFWITRPVTHVLNARFNYFLPYGLAQKRSEEFNDWEPGSGHGRKFYDGLSFRYSVMVNPDAASDEDRGFARRYSLTWTTGYYDPARHNTFKAEWNFAIFNRLPLTFWFRYGYNRDLVDYYVKDHSFGLSLSYWNF